MPSRNVVESCKKILDPTANEDDFQNLTSFFLSIHHKFMVKFFTKICSTFFYIKLLTDIRTGRHTDKRRALRNLFGGDNFTPQRLHFVLL